MYNIIRYLINDIRQTDLVMLNNKRCDLLLPNDKQTGYSREIHLKNEVETHSI